MKCPKCKGSNLTADQRTATASSKYGASNFHRGLARSGHPVGAAIVGACQVGVAVHETFFITYTCHECKHTFNKFQSWNLF